MTPEVNDHKDSLLLCLFQWERKWLSFTSLTRKLVLIISTTTTKKPYVS